MRGNKNYRSIWHLQWHNSRWWNRSVRKNVQYVAQQTGLLPTSQTSMQRGEEKTEVCQTHKSCNDTLLLKLLHADSFISSAIMFHFPKSIPTTKSSLMELFWYGESTMEKEQLRLKHVVKQGGCQYAFTGSSWDINASRFWQHLGSNKKGYFHNEILYIWQKKEYFCLIR